MIQGETLKLSVTASDASAVEFRIGGASTHAAAATYDAGLWTASLSTAAWAVGNYRWQAWTTHPDGITVVASREFIITAPLAVGDLRSSARKMVEMIEAMMAGNASEGVKQYKINNRELERYGVGELIQLLSYWKNRLAIEGRKERGASTLGPRIEVRF